MIPLVFVHGFLGGSRQWQAQKEAFAESYEVITVDLPGYGENAHLAAISTIHGFAQWVMRVLEEKGVERFHLVGHSMGGMIVQEIVALAPDKVDRLVLYGTGATGVLPGRFETIDTSKLRACNDGPQTTARRIASTWFLDREKSVAYADCAKIAEQSELPAILSGLDAMQSWNGVSKLPHVLARTLVVWGDHDRTYTWEQTAQLWSSIANSSLAVVPDCAHAVHLEKPILFNKILADFLST